MVFDNIHNYYETLVVRRLNDMIQAEFIERLRSRGPSGGESGFWKSTQVK